MDSPHCLGCKKEFAYRWQKKFCSNQCQADFRYETFKLEWLSGKRVVVTKNISRHLKRFLIETQGEKCSECHWNKKNPITKKVPIEVDHIDGNADNNKRANLRLLCPNCHALTPSFRNLNKGKGRGWRNKNARKAS